MRIPSEHERRQLYQIEAALRASDPRLDRALRTFRPRRTGLTLFLIMCWVAVMGLGFTNWWAVTFIALGPLLALTIFTLRPPWRTSPSR